MRRDTLPASHWGEGIGSYSREELAAIQGIPADEEALWLPYAGPCIKDPEKFEVRGAAQRRVARECARCAIQAQCGEYALGMALDGDVVLGGMTARERRAILKNNPEVVWKHRKLPK